MSNIPRHKFPSADGKPEKPASNAGSNANPAPKPPGWLEKKGQAPQGGSEVKSLLSMLQGDAQPPSRAVHEPPPQAASSPPPPPPPPAPHPEHELPQEHELHALDGPGEVVINKLPAPPRLGSLVPGGRSQPPPANDRDQGLAERTQAYASAAIELAIARAATLAVLEGQLLDLAVEVAEAIIEKEVSSDRTLHAALSRAALQSLGDAKQVILRTSPDGFDAITESFGGEEIDIRGVHVQIVADPTMPGLGCVVDGDNVRVDATVNERLRAVRRAFEEERRRATENVE